MVAKPLRAGGRAAAVLTVAAALASCVTGPLGPTRPAAIAPAAGPAAAVTPRSAAVPSELTYVEPIGEPAGPEDTLVDQRPEVALADIRQRLGDGAFSLAATEREDVLVAVYRGNGDPYVDCGTIFAFERGLSQPPTRIAAIAEEAQVSALPQRASASAKRTMRLDARLTVQVTPDGPRTRVRSRADYVLTKLIEVPGRSLPSREVINFASGETGRFGKGTVCKPTGLLEQLPLAGLPVVPGS